MWTHLLHLLWRAWLVLVSSTSTNNLGLFVWTLCIAVAFWLAQRFRRWLRIRKRIPGWKGVAAVIKTSLADTLWDLGSTALVVVIAWGCFVIKTIYDDHTALAASVLGLRAFAKAEPDYAHQLANAQAKADQWRDDYFKISKGEIVPDRYLNRDEMDQLHDKLKAYAKNSGDRKYSTVRIGPAFADDWEASHLAAQLLKVFHGAEWNIKPDFSHKEVPLPLLMGSPPGVAIFTDDPHNQGLWIMWILKDAGIDSYVAYDTPQGFKGTLICVEHKQQYEQVQW
jgi:hypothetical protein